MMMAKFMFRLLLLLSLASAVGALWLERMPSTTAAVWSAATAHRGDGAVPWERLLAENTGWEVTPEGLLIGQGALYAAVLLGYLGMFFFSRLGRGLFGMSVLLFVLIGMGSGLAVQSPEQQALIHLGLLTDGALLALAYASPLAELFGGRAARAAEAGLPAEISAGTGNDWRQAALPSAPEAVPAPAPVAAPAPAPVLAPVAAAGLVMAAGEATAVAAPSATALAHSTVAAAPDTDEAMPPVPQI
jgi:hypothetical protein